MKAIDLMIGDYCLVKPSMMPIKVAAVHQKKVAYHAVPNKLNWVRESLLEPIRLITSEILEKNGFTPIYHDKSAYKWKEYDNDDNIQSIVIDFQVKRTCEVWNGKARKSYKGEILCLHELQHIMKICGINKTIEL
jgi:CxxC motif-containing protein